MQDLDNSLPLGNPRSSSDCEFHCTCVAARRHWRGESNTLDVAAARCGYDLKSHHNALADAEACAAIALQIL